MAIDNKRRGMLTYGVVLLRDNAHPHTAACTRALLEHFNWELFVYHLFTCLKNWLVSQHFSNNEELLEGVKKWLSSQAANFFDRHTKLIPLYDKCLNSGGDYVEKYFKYLRIAVA
jgi:hypothetical protein